MYSKDIELRHLRYFVAVAEELHFSRAAEKLQIAQPPLSQQIRQLEHMLGVRLFERNYHTVTLTAAGEVFLAEARHVLDEMEQALARMQDAKQGLVGRLNIGYFQSAEVTDAIIPAILQLYRQRFPTVEIQLRATNLQEQWQAIQAQEIQLGFAACSSDLPKDLDMLVIERIPLVVVCAPEHPLASQPAIALRSLINEAFIFCHRQASHFFYDRIVQLCGFSPHITQEVADLRMLLGLVAANMGISIVPASAVSMRDQGVIYRPLANLHEADIIETLLVWRRADSSPLVQNFLTATREVLEQRNKSVASIRE
ncbi:LysR substrate-binding domain-containing protein [Ktedonosporobacter rubrisoli]|nr:LysR substrate-binding domain-containing protein [Ktedonosporobacter rubrisoli]